VLGYITIDDVLGTPDDGAPRPLEPSAPPATLAALYDRGMRRHARRAALLHWQDGRLEATPDWRFDRRVIRVALYGRERLRVEPGERVAVFGRLAPAWPVAEFAALGFGAAVVGLEHDLSDDALRAALQATQPRLAFASDAESAARLLRLRAGAGGPESVVVPDGIAADAAGVQPLAQVLDFGAALDTAERAQNFRLCSRTVPEDAPALWHFTAHADGASGGAARLTHAAAARRLAPRLKRPVLPGDVAYFEAPRVTLGARLGWHAGLGGGCATLALGRDGHASEDLAELRPHLLVGSRDWIERAWAEVERDSDGLLRRLARLVPRSALLRRLALRGPWVRRAWRARLGDRLRLVELSSPPGGDLASALTAAGVEWEVDGFGAG
jgi:hypothetical protein